MDGAHADREREKLLAAEAAAALVEDGTRVGLGTGSTAGYFVRALAERGLTVRCVATSPQTERLAAELGLAVEPFAGRRSVERLHIAVDGADQIAADGWVVKGGGGAHTREKIVAAAATRFVVIASSDKLVERGGGARPRGVRDLGDPGPAVRRPRPPRWSCGPAP